jgi:hypothetical protein
MNSLFNKLGLFGWFVTQIIPMDDLLKYYIQISVLILFFFYFIEMFIIPRFKN